jgi:16S rRNA (guanine966-N2)-methyltransferase
MAGVRIVGGTLKGRHLRVPKKGVRPTSERVREALMSLLGADWGGRRVLDCFAGSGAFGFEALSRGADSVVFIERDRNACLLLNETAATFQVTDKIEVFQGDALAVLNRLHSKADPFDILFFDPPYQNDDAPSVLQQSQDLGNASARFVYEHDNRISLAEIQGGLVQTDRRRYGTTAVTIFSINDTNEVSCNAASPTEVEPT